MESVCVRCVFACAVGAVVLSLYQSASPPSRGAPPFPFVWLCARQSHTHHTPAPPLTIAWRYLRALLLALPCLHAGESLQTQDEGKKSKSKKGTTPLVSEVPSAEVTVWHHVMGLRRCEDEGCSSRAQTGQWRSRKERVVEVMKGTETQ